MLARTAGALRRERDITFGVLVGAALRLWLIRRTRWWVRREMQRREREIAGTERAIARPEAVPRHRRTRRGGAG
jgi:hypothetical protein